jgi:hypothetical protein
MDVKDAIWLLFTGALENADGEAEHAKVVNAMKVVVRVLFPTEDETETVKRKQMWRVRPD